MTNAFFCWLKRQIAGPELATLELYRCHIQQIEKWFCGHAPDVARVAVWIRAYSELKDDPRWPASGQDIGALRKSVNDERAQAIARLRSDADVVVDLILLLRRRPDMVEHVREVLPPQQVPAPAPAKWLFIAKGEPGDPASLTWCADDAAVTKAVGAAMFVDGYDWRTEADHADQVHGTAESLIEDGFVDFEGDPGLLLIRVDEAPRAMPASNPNT